MDELKPCNLRQVDVHGRILCSAIKGGDREVSVQLCRACPVSQINCQNLRAGLEKKVSTPITVRFATGRVEVWDDAPPQIDFKQAACAAKTMPIHSPRDCAGCQIRVPNVIPLNAIQMAHRSKQNVPAAVQTAAVAQAAPSVRAARGAGRAAQPVAQPVAQTVAQTVAQMVAQPIAQITTQPVAQSAPQAQPAARAPVTRAPMPAQAAAQMQAPVQPIAREQAATYAAGIDLGAASDLIARAQATAARKADEKRIRELEEQLAAQTQQAQQAQQQAQQTQPVATTETKSKIIQIQDWLAGQASKKQNGEKRANNMYKPQTVMPDADGVSDIIYAPLGAQMSAAYQETIDYERCVGWTD